MQFIVRKPALLRTVSKLAVLVIALAISQAQANVVEYDLAIAEEKMAPAGKTLKVLAINGTIPGPTLRFKEGDIARVRVHNHLKKETTSVHWHGLLLPNREDGVPYLTTPPIHPGQTHTFEFPLTHSGTYWYHSHTGLQEQRGVYGSIVVEPKNGEPVPTDREHVLVISDWTNENPDEVMRTLMRGSDYYSIRKGNAQSIVGAIRAGALRDYFDREKSRMPAMDISDVAYDAFLINGKSRSFLEGKPGETVRLRIINAAASTYFYLQSATGPMTIVANDGPPVKPIKVNRLFLAVAETYDVLVTLPQSGAWEFRATAQDGSGYASVFLGEGPEHSAPDVPTPDLYRMDETLLAGIMDAQKSGQLTDEQALAAEIPRPLSPYRRLQSTIPTSFDPTNEVRTIPMRLTGDMERYIWSINGKTLKEDMTILIERGEILRLELINDTMMHHPMHLHGHFFRVLEGHDTNAPLKHTIDVPPMGRRTIEFLANEEGDWFFHCHILYHMEGGMGRVFSYREQGPDHKPTFGPVNLDPYWFMVDGSIQTHMSMGMTTLMSSRNNFNLLWDIGIEHDTAGRDHKHQFDYEIDLTYSRYIDPNISVFGGFRFTNEKGAENRGIAGLTYRLPYLLRSEVALDTRGDLRLRLGKSFQITDRFSLFTEGEYDTRSGFEWRGGAEYWLSKRFSLISEYHTEHGIGGGITFRF
ncbi:MAG: multicopper oxidase domain-containing protein [Verrucomicrobia bacterium]|nr:multicopper oxidase domain-containing protein [Verrucomicrobiota bacterium]